jgi:hypothetical protein
MAKKKAPIFYVTEYLDSSEVTAEYGKEALQSDKRQRKLITPQPVMQLARVLADADGMMDITDNDLVECGYVAMARAALDHLQGPNTTNRTK